MINRINPKEAPQGYNPDGTINADNLFSVAVQCVRRYGIFAAIRHLRLTNPAFINRVLNEVKSS